MARGIKLLITLPIERKHGAVRGAIFRLQAITIERNGRAWFFGLVGELCAARAGEYEVVEYNRRTRFLRVLDV